MSPAVACRPSYKTPSLEKLSKERMLGFSKEEIAVIGEFFNKLNRRPTMPEIEMIAQAWSEHTRHKTLKGRYACSVARDASEEKKNSVPRSTRHYSNLLEETVFVATKKLKKPWVLSAFKDNAGIVAFDKKWALAVKVETHNHPSALMPYGGASTGMGGVIRDVLGAGLSASPMAGLDVFCVAPSEPQVLEGLAAGVRDYGNRMGIPTVAGGIFYDEAYRGLPLVFCGCLGLLPRAKVFKRGPKAHDLIYVAGGKTGKDGIHGATFSSQALTEDLTSSVVQIGNPILEKKLWDFLMAARDENLFTSITDLGAGGIACAVWEMAASVQHLGIECALDAVPLKQSGMQEWEILVSESQERVMVSVPAASAKRLEGLLESFELDYTCLGRFVPGGQARISYKGEPIVDLPIRLLKEVPKKRFTLQVPRFKFENNSFSERATWSVQLGTRNLHRFGLGLLSSPNIASKERVIRQYDHEVGGRTVIKPLAGLDGAAPTDAAVLRPLNSSCKGVAIGIGWKGDWSRDPRRMALGAFEEALRNVIAVGGVLQNISVLDNYCAGLTSDPEVLAQVVQISEALRDASLAFGVPFISGKDSLNNTTSQGASCPTTVLITAVAVLKDIQRCVTPVLKSKDSFIYLVGLTSDEEAKGAVPGVDLKVSPKILSRVSQILSQGKALACHDLSDGGLFVALAEMVMASPWGAEIELDSVLSPTRDPRLLLFGESNSRFLIEVSPRQALSVERALKGIPWSRVGRVIKAPVFRAREKSKFFVSWKRDELLGAFQRT